MRGIEAADVEGRIGLGIAEPLRFLQAIGEGQPLLMHAGEDVIAGAVEDAVNPADPAAAQSLAQRLDDGNAAGNRRLEIKCRAVLLRQLGKRDAVPGEQSLVGGHDRTSHGERGLDRAFRRIALPAHQFDKDIDVGIAGQRQRIGDLAHAGQVERGVLAADPCWHRRRARSSGRRAR